MLVLTRKPGESLMIGDNIEVKIIDASGEQVKVGISAPNKVRILRKELFQTIEENQQAVHKVTDRGALKNLLTKLT